MPCAAFKDKRTEVVAELKRLQAETDPIIKIFEDQEIAESIQNTRYYFNLHRPTITTTSLVMCHGPGSRASLPVFSYPLASRICCTQATLRPRPNQLKAITMSLSAELR